MRTELRRSPQTARPVPHLNPRVWDKMSPAGGRGVRLDPGLSRMDQDRQTRSLVEAALSFPFTYFRFATQTAPPTRTLLSVFFRYLFRRLTRNRSHPTISSIPKGTFSRFFRCILSLLPPSSHLPISFPPPPLPPTPLAATDTLFRFLSNLPPPRGTLPRLSRPAAPHGRGTDPPGKTPDHDPPEPNTVPNASSSPPATHPFHPFNLFHP